MSSDNPFRIPLDSELFTPAPVRSAPLPARAKRVMTFGERLPQDAVKAGRATVSSEESLSTYIEKKKEIFWVQMTLDIKKQEMHKLQTKTKERQQTLVDAQKLLDEDLARFDQFLIANDARAMNALKAADQLAKQKAEKINTEKILLAQIKNEQDEINDLLEKVETGRKLKDFLLSVLGSDDFNASSINKKPEELLAVFAGLEEQNLFLIQNVQESQQQLEEQQEFLKRLKTQMETKIQEENNKHVHAQIQEELERCKLLQEKIHRSGKNGSLAGVIAELTKGIKLLASCFGKDFADNQEPTIMLTGIERKFEEILKVIAEGEAINAEIIGKLERAKEMERREKLRAEKFQEQVARNEARLKLSMLRAQAPIFKKTGKQLMFRSEPVRKEKVHVVDDAEQRERAETLDMFGLYVDKEGNVITQ
jgi:hypothetical protein